jgi:hypothetical protein
MNESIPTYKKKLPADRTNPTDKNSKSFMSQQIDEPNDQAFTVGFIDLSSLKSLQYAR